MIKKSVLTSKQNVNQTQITKDKNLLDKLPSGLEDENRWVDAKSKPWMI